MCPIISWLYYHRFQYFLPLGLNKQYSMAWCHEYWKIRTVLHFIQQEIPFWERELFLTVKIAEVFFSSCLLSPSDKPYWLRLFSPAVLTGFFSHSHFLFFIALLCSIFQNNVKSKKKEWEHNTSTVLKVSF